MKYTVAVAATLASSVLAISSGGYLPNCSWNDCMNVWDSGSCTSSSGWDCLCSNTTALAQINTCVATSCKNATDQEAIYGAIAQLCANAGKSVSASQEATFKATSGGSLAPSATGGFGPNGQWNGSAWSSWASAVSTAVGSAPSGWGPDSGPWGSASGFPNGFGGFGSGQSGSLGPFGTKASGIACSGVASWTTWTAGWGPFSSWTGIWSGCSSTTATPSPATITTTMTTSGRATVVTGTTFGVQALSTSAGSVSSSTSIASSSSIFETTNVLKYASAIVGFTFTLMLAL